MSLTFVYSAPSVSVGDNRSNKQAAALSMAGQSEGRGEPGLQCLWRVLISLLYVETERIR